MVALQRRHLFWGLVGVAIVCTGVAFWSLSRSLPVEEARRFLHAPIEIGEEAPASAQPAADAEIARRFADAQSHFKAADYRAAADAFARVVESNPRGPLAGPAQWNLTRSRLRSGQGNAALEGLEGLLRHYAGYLEQESPALREGLDQMAAGQMAAAHQAFDRMIAEQPDSEFVPLAYAMKARIYWNHGQPMEAVGAFGDLFASVRDDVETYRDLAGLLERYSKGDADVAADFAQRAQEVDDGFGDIYQYLAARSLLEQNRFEAARDAFDELGSEYAGGDFTHIVDLEHAWNLFRNSQPEEALEIFRRLEKETAPQQAQAFDEFFDLRAELPMGIARCQLALGNYEQALSAFERAIAKHPRSIYVLENQLGMALAYERLGRFDDATELLSRTIDEHPDEPKLWAVRQQMARIERQKP